MIVLIDDERTFKPSVLSEDYVLFKTVTEAIEWLDTTTVDTVVDQLWFDHDLGLVDGVKETVIPFLRKLEERCFEGTAPVIREVIVHTTNAPGGKDIVAAMSRYFKTHRVAAGDYLEVRK